MCRTAARLCPGAGGRRVRRSDSPCCRLVEGAGSAPDRRLGGANRRGDSGATPRRLRRCRSPGSGSAAQARPSRGERPRPRARSALGLVGGGAPAASATLGSAARLGRRCAAAQRRRRVSSCLLATARPARGRRLYNGRNRKCRGVCTPKSRGPKSRGRELRPDDSRPLTFRFRPENRRRECGFP